MRRLLTQPKECLAGSNRRLVAARSLKRSDGSSSRVVVDVIDGAGINLSVAVGTINDSGAVEGRGVRWTRAIDQSAALGISVERNLNYSPNNPDVS